MTGSVYFTLECFEFSSNFEFDRNIVSGTGAWSNEIKRRRLKWFGHLLRLPENAPAKQALAEARKPYKKISGGQPTTWLSTIKKDFSEMNYNLKEAFEIAYDRDIYTKLVSAQ